MKEEEDKDEEKKRRKRRRSKQTIAFNGALKKYRQTWDKEKTTKNNKALSTEMKMAGKTEYFIHNAKFSCEVSFLTAFIT